MGLIGKAATRGEVRPRYRPGLPGLPHLEQGAFDATEAAQCPQRLPTPSLDAALEIARAATPTGGRGVGCESGGPIAERAITHSAVRKSCAPQRREKAFDHGDARRVIS